MLGMLNSPDIWVLNLSTRLPPPLWGTPHVKIITKSKLRQKTRLLVKHHEYTVDILKRRIFRYTAGIWVNGSTTDIRQTADMWVHSGYMYIWRICGCTADTWTHGSRNQNMAKLTITYPRRRNIQWIYERFALNLSHGGQNWRTLTAISGHRANQADKILNTKLGWRFTEVVFTPL